MSRVMHWATTAIAVSAVVGLAEACSSDQPLALPVAPSLSQAATNGPFQFDPLPASTVCTVAGGNPVKPFVVPAGFDQVAVASEPAYGDDADMNTLNETGPRAGRYLYTAHETGGNGSLSVTDLTTGVTRTMVQRADWERLDPTVWTPWGTILIAEETNAAAFRDPQYPAAVAGLVYEVFPSASDPTVADSVVARPALGSKSHEGMRFDPQGNLYSISERNPGYIFRFVPDRRGDLSSGQLYALKVTTPTGDRTGPAEWIPLDRAAVQVDASLEGDRVHATGYNRPEDVEIATSTGNNHGGANTLYVAVTSPTAPNPDNRVLGIDLREPAGGSEHATAFVYDYVRVGLNATTEFEWPDNLALDRAGNLYIAEDPGGNFRNGTGKTKGDDIWAATPNKGDSHGPASSVVRFASLTDCDAEPTGIYFDQGGHTLFVNAQHRGGDRLDKTMAIFPIDRANAGAR